MADAPIVRYHVQRADGLFMCYDRHSDTDDVFWDAWGEPFVCEFVRPETAHAWAVGGHTVRVSIDDRLV